MRWTEKLRMWKAQDDRQKHLNKVSDIPVKAKKYSIENAEKMTPAEIKLGEIIISLKSKFPDIKIVPQKPLKENKDSESFYIADYYIKKPYHIVIEADGEYHKNRKAYDRRRDKTMTGHGVRVLRFTNGEILENPDRVRVSIEVALFVRSS